MSTFNRRSGSFHHKRHLRTLYRDLQQQLYVRIEDSNLIAIEQHLNPNDWLVHPIKEYRAKQIGL